MSPSNPAPSALSRQRRELISSRLTALEPSHLEVIDESHQHVGHAGSTDGANHFRVIIASSQFQGLTPVARHRLVYDRLSDLIPHPVHALAIETRPNP